MKTKEDIGDDINKAWDAYDKDPGAVPDMLIFTHEQTVTIAKLAFLNGMLAGINIMNPKKP